MKGERSSEDSDSIEEEVPTEVPEKKEPAACLGGTAEPVLAKAALSPLSGTGSALATGPFMLEFKPNSPGRSTYNPGGELLILCVLFVMKIRSLFFKYFFLFFLFLLFFFLCTFYSPFVYFYFLRAYCILSFTIVIESSLKSILKIAWINPVPC